MDTVFAERAGRIDLVKIVKGMAPERRPPFVVELTYVIMVFFTQERAEFLLTLLAIAEAAEFVGNMPHFYARMIGKAFGKHAVDFGNFFAKDGRRDTMVVTQSMRALGTV